MAPYAFSNGDALSSDDSGNLEEISWKLEPRTGKLQLAGRCHKLPRTLESDYKLTSKVLGSGYSGDVRLAQQKLNEKQTVAVKTFKLKGLRGQKKERLLSEISVFLCMDHPHVARLLDVYETESQISLVMECMEGGELFDRVTKEKHFAEPAAADATRQMLLALNYVHSHGIVHRDLKLENFLYDTSGGSHLKMIDFGFSRFSDSKSRMKTSCGTLAYVAPEVLKKNYTSQADLWSMGVIVFILLSGHMPFHGDSEDQVQDIKYGRYVFKHEHWSKVSEEAKQFTRALLEVDPLKRLTAKSALEHRWISQVAEKAMPKVDMSILHGIQSWAEAPQLMRVFRSMMAWSLTNKQHAQVREHFVAMDRDRDGIISFEDLRLALSCAQDSKDAAQQELERTALSFASTHAGKELQIHYSDFLAAMTGNRIKLDQELLQTAFHKFDRRGVGVVSRQDLRELLGASFEGSDIDSLLDEAGALSESGFGFEDFATYVRFQNSFGRGPQQQQLHAGAALPRTMQKSSSSQKGAPALPQRMRLVEAAYQKKTEAADARSAPLQPRANQMSCCCLQ